MADKIRLKLDEDEAEVLKDTLNEAIKRGGDCVSDVEIMIDIFRKLEKELGGGNGDC